MYRVTASLALFAILFSQVLTPAGAQDKAASTKLAFRTNFVLVPVVVTDKRGSHVRGLTRDDFEVKEDGKIQAIAGFEEIIADSSPVQRAAVLPDTFTNQVSDQRAKDLQIIALDLLNTRFTNQAEARRGLLEFLSKSVNENALLALVVFHPNGVRLIHNFTSDRSVLAAAIKKMQGRVSSRDTAAMNIAGDEDAEAAQLEAILAGAAAEGSTAGSVGNAAAAGALSRTAAAAARMDAARQTQEGTITLECFQQVAQYFAAVPGRKSLIWASSGFRFNIGGGTGADLTKGTTPDEWQRTVRILQEANIAVYPVDVSGLVGGIRAPVNMANIMPPPTSGAEGGVNARSAAMEAYESGMFTDPVQAKHDTMRAVSDMTGGQAFYNNNDLEDLFRRAGQDSAEYYLLTYKTGESGKSGWRKLEVRVHRDGAQVRSRTGFFYTKAARDPESSHQLDEILALSSSLNFTSLPITAAWQQTEPAGNNLKVHFSLAIPPGAADIDTDHENHINVDFLTVALNASGQEAAKVTQRIDRKLPPAGVTQIQASGITYTNVLTLPPGVYNVHFVVRDNLTGKIGSLVAPLKVAN